MALTTAEKSRRYKERKKAAIDALPKIECGCGCGTLIAPISKRDFKPARYAHGHNPYGEATRFRPGHTLSPEAAANLEAHRARGKRNGQWSGGEWRARGGYVRRTLTAEEAVRMPTALRHSDSWSIPRSHYVWNLAHPDDVVQPGYEVHHKNLIRDDDRVENLEKLTPDEHRAAHAGRRGPYKTACKHGHAYAEHRRYPEGGKPYCGKCSELHDLRRAQERRRKTAS
jgi:hypothetical protein